MVMSARTKEIIQIVTAARGYITIKEIAAGMGISERTVYREIPEVTKVLAEYDIILETVSKKGIRLTGKKENIQRLFQNLNDNVRVQVVDPRERLYLILLKLLHKEDFLKTESLAIDLRTSLSTIRNDLKKVGKAASDFHLRLVQKKGEGIMLQGTQMEKDHLLVYALVENVEIQDLYVWLEGEFEKSNFFLQEMEKYEYDKIFMELHGIFRNLGEKLEKKKLYIEDIGYVEMIFFLACMLERHRNGHQETAENYQVKEIGRDEKEVSIYIEEEIREHFQIVFEEEEKKYLAWIVRNCMALHQKQTPLEFNPKIRRKISEFVRLVEEAMGIYLSQDQKLMEGLIVHIDKALKRTRSGMSISNPILHEIEKDYEQLFSIVKSSVYKVFPEDYFPDDEIGYLVLYFAVSLDNITKKTFRILVVCSSGMGSSKMLASRLEREIPEIYVRKIVSLIGLGKEDLNEYDLILSTVPLYLNSNDYLKVSPLLNPQELEMVKEKIRKHKHKTLKRIGKHERNAGKWESMDGMLELSQLNEFTRYSIQLLQDFTVLELSADLKIEMIYEKIGKWSEEINLNLNGTKLLQYYYDRNMMECYFVIPSTKVSYFECFLEKIKKPALLVCHFKDKEMEEQTGEKVRSMVALFYPKKLKALEREFVGTITDTIIDDANVIRMIEEGDEEGIRNCLSIRFLEYIKNIV